MRKILLALALVVAFAPCAFAVDNSALEFDGVNDYVTVPDSSDWAAGTGNFTVNFWVKWNDLAGIQTFVSQKEDDDNAWLLYKAADQSLRLYFMSGGDIKAQYGAYPDLSVSTWYNLAFVRNGSDVSMYVDGVDKKSVTWNAIGTNDLGDIDGKLKIGTYGPDGGENYFLNGQMDELGIWGKAMIQEEVENLMHNSPAGPQANMAAYWNFNEGSGQVLGDLTANAHNGQLGSTPGIDINDPQWVNGAPVNVVPEPVSSALFLVGGITLAAIQYRKRRKA